MTDNFEAVEPIKAWLVLDDQRRLLSLKAFLSQDEAQWWCADNGGTYITEVTFKL